MSELYHENPALRTGAQIHRYSSDGPGVYAFSRIDRNERVEYVVALNNSESAQTVEVATFSAGRAKFRAVTHGPYRTSARTAADGSLSVTVPALGYVVYKAENPLPASDAAPGISITSLEHGDTAALETHTWDGHQVVDRIEVAAELDADVFAEVTFAVREGNGPFVPIGTDDNAPYRVFYDASHLRGQEVVGSFESCRHVV